MTEPKLRKIVKNFGPQWFGSTMGTGAMGIAICLISGILESKILLRVSQAIIILTIILYIIYVALSVFRFAGHLDHVIDDLKHPIRGQFFPTIFISLIIIGIGVTRALDGFLCFEDLKIILNGIFWTGTTGILILGFILVPTMLTGNEIDLEHGVFAWYIPPVSHLQIAVLGFLIIGKYHIGTTLGELIGLISFFSLGIGFFMFIFLGAIVLHRYAYSDLPGEKLAPTFVIGLAPTSVLVIALVRMIHAFKIGSILGIDFVSMVPLVEVVTISLWGFSLWWFVITLVIILHYVKNRSHPFFFTWWAYTFPLGAFAISAGSLHHLIGTDFFKYTLIMITSLLLVVWLLTSSLTIRMIIRGNAFNSD